MIYWAFIYPFLQRFDRKWKCFFNHRWVDSKDKKNIQICTKCGEKQLVIYAIFDDE